MKSRKKQREFKIPRNLVDDINRFTDQDKQYILLTIFNFFLSQKEPVFPDKKDHLIDAFNAFKVHDESYRSHHEYISKTQGAKKLQPRLHHVNRKQLTINNTKKDSIMNDLQPRLQTVDTKSIATVDVKVVQPRLQVPDNKPIATTDATPPACINNIHTMNISSNKHEDKIKNKYLEHVYLTQDEYDRLLKEYGQPILNKCIDKLDLWFLNNPKKYKTYKDHNRIIRGWVYTAVMEEEARLSKSRYLLSMPSATQDTPQPAEATPRTKDILLAIKDVDYMIGNNDATLKETAEGIDKLSREDRIEWRLKNECYPPVVLTSEEKQQIAKKEYKS